MHFSPLLQKDAEQFRVLGLEEGADAKSIRSAYLRKAKSTHPDKGGSREAFSQVQQAYVNLSGRDPDATGGNTPEPFPTDLPESYFRRVSCMACLGSGSRCHVHVEGQTTHVLNTPCEACEGRGYFSPSPAQHAL
jgi:DnaJ-class molecular chaperone